MKRARLLPTLAPIIAVFALASAGYAQDAKAPVQETLVLANATVHRGDGTTTVGSVRIEYGRIAEVGTVSTEGARTIDAQGLHLYPGFIDAYRTDGAKLPPATQAASRPGTNANAFPTMWAGNRKNLNADWRAADNLDYQGDESDYASGITTALIASTLGTMRGEVAAIDLLPASVENRLLAPNAGQVFSFRSTGGFQGYPSNILGVIAQMRQAFYDAQTLSKDGDLGSEATDALPALQAMIPVATGRATAIFDVALDREIGRAITLSHEFGFPLVIAGGRDAGLITDGLKDANVKVLLSAGFGIEPSQAPPKPDDPPADAIPAEYQAERHDRWAEQGRVAGKLAAAGVPFAFASEGDSVREFLPNVRRHIANGLDPQAAERALTSGAAAILGLGEVGEIAPGKRANVTLWTGEFNRAESKVKLAIIDGRVVFTAKEAGK